MLHDPKRTAALIIAGMPKDGPDASADGPDGMGGHDEDLHGLAEDLISAVHSKDAAAVADAFRAMFLAMESEPHDEAEEPDEEGDSEMAG